MVFQELSELLNLGVILNVEGAPLESLWERDRVLWNFVLVEMLYFALFGNLFSSCYNSLIVPEVVLTEYLNDVFIPVPLLKMLRLVLCHLLELPQHFLLIKICTLPINPTLHTSFFNTINRIKPTQIHLLLTLLLLFLLLPLLLPCSTTLTSLTCLASPLITLSTILRSPILTLVILVGSTGGTTVFLVFLLFLALLLLVCSVLEEGRVHKGGLLLGLLFTSALSILLGLTNTFKILNRLRIHI